MGGSIWDYISSSANAVNQNAVIPVWKLCATSYSYGRAATSKIANAISAVPADDASQFASTFAKNAAVFACRESLKTIPGGGPLFDIVSRSVPKNSNLENNKKQQQLQAVSNEMKDQGKQIQELNEVVGKLREEINALKQVAHQEQVLDAEFESKLQEARKTQATTIRYVMAQSLHSNASKQPVDMIQHMISMGFLSCYCFDHLDIPKECPE